MLRGYDTVTLVLSLTAVALFALLAYVAIGSFGVVVVPLVVGVFYLLPGDILKSINTNGVRLALLLINGMLVGWIPAEYLGDSPLDEAGEFTFTAGLVLFAFGFAAFFAFLYSARRYYHISTTPTSDIASVEEGTVEVEGELEPARETLTAPVSGEDCVAYEYEATQRRQLIPGGRRYTAVVDSEHDGVPFYVDDGTGRVLVYSEGAQIAVDVRETESREAGSSEYERATTLKEVRVPDEGRVYVFGSAGWSEEHGEAVIQGDGAPFFKISDSSESELVERYRKLAVLGLLVALVGLPGGSWLILRSSGVL